jgi:hypothetical protein|nr:DUF5916 domain-containing protein [Kofleriaceae bacterium]
MLRYVVAIAIVCSCALAHADAVRGHAVRRTGDIKIDGHLDEPDWASAPKQTHFTQRYPKDNAPPTLETRFAILYDDDAIYVGVWADDPDPGAVRRLLTRRDVDAPADAVIIGFDSYHDRRTAYAFQLNAAGVQRDMLMFDDTNQDDTWDAVWTGNSAITDTGWTAEYRIPLSQLRYAAGDLHEWGFQVVRTVARTQEQSAWSPWPRSTPQVVSRFGVIDGIDHLKPARRLELLPYVTGGVDVAPIDAGDPLNSHVTGRDGIGLDVKYGLGPAFTLSATINPDFGQVEADPSQITLGPYELFYPEKRPFFLEGVDLFKLPMGNDGGSPEGQFYSRRIGEAPENEPSDYTYINWPQATTIYGAAKLTGHTASGWSLGVLDAVTGRESASIVDDYGVRSDPVVAPLTNYAVGRVKHDFLDGSLQIGLSGTAVNRDLSNLPELAATLHDQAYTTGTQITDRWDDNKWLLTLQATGSYIHGSADAIGATQLDNNHLFQRVGATDTRYVPNATSMEGWGTSFQFGRLGDTPHWRTGFGDDIRSPGLELNDLGFQRGSDRMIPYLWTQYREDKPSDAVLNWQINADVFSIDSFERVEDLGIEWNASATLPNLWSGFVGGAYDHAMWDQVAMRGGPTMRVDPTTTLYGGLNSDNRKMVYASLFTRFARNPTTNATDTSVSIGATLQARPNVSLFLGPSYEERYDSMQYVDVVATDEPHYIFSSIRQVTSAMTARLDWTFSTTLSLQAYAQPFIATGRYSDYKDVDNPQAAAFSDRFHAIQGNEWSVANDVVYIHRPGALAFNFDLPDFDVLQLRSTVVLRWEYRPGSTVFAIWSHNQSDSDYDGRYRPGADLKTLYNTAGENIVMVKVNYWLGL